MLEGLRSGPTRFVVPVIPGPDGATLVARPAPQCIACGQRGANVGPFYPNGEGTVEVEALCVDFALCAQRSREAAA